VREARIIVAEPRQRWAMSHPVKYTPMEYTLKPSERQHAKIYIEV